MLARFIRFSASTTIVFTVLSHLPYFTSIIVTVISPPGVVTVTFSPFLWPTNPLAIGDSFEILPFNGSASAAPTIWYVSGSSSSSWNVTDFPTETSSASTFVVDDFSVVQHVVNFLDPTFNK